MNLEIDDIARTNGVICIIRLVFLRERKKTGL
jgi:hypothetical protein